MRKASGAMTIDVVDDFDHPVGTIERRAILGSGMTFRTVHVFLANSSREILLQRLAAGRPRHAGLWGSSVAGYLHAGEDYEAAAKRRLGKELGLSDIALSLAGKLMMPEEGARKFVTLFLGRHSGTVMPDPAIIAEVRWRAITSIASDLREAPQQYTPTFALLFGRFGRGVQVDERS